MKLRIAVVGSGYVGLVSAVCFAELGHEVICIDNDAAKVAALTRGEVPIHEEFLPELLAKHRGRRLRFSGELAPSIRDANAVFIAVGTPPAASGAADLSYVESVAREIAEGLNGYKVIVEKSTVPVYTNEWVRRVVTMNVREHAEFDVVSNPEFLREGTAIRDFLYPDRIVVGTNTDRAATLMQAIYQPLTDGSYHRSESAVPPPEGAQVPSQLIVTSAKSAELIKHASNAFLALKISFINAVSNICDAVGADVQEVGRGIGTDKRIGPRFLQAGIGYGGSCFPKDVAAFRNVAREYGYDFGLLDEVARINHDQRERFLRKVRTALWTLKGKRLAVLGLSFKGGTDDCRESPAIDIVQAVLKEGSEVAAYDPAGMERAKTQLEGKVGFGKDAYSVMQGADALLILTDWPEFAALDLQKVKQNLRHQIVIDGRNLFEPAKMAAAGITYHSMGRASVDLIAGKLKASAESK